MHKSAFDMTVEKNAKKLSTMYFADGRSCQDMDSFFRVKEGMEWMLEKAIDWLKVNINEYAYECQTGKEGVMVESMLKDFKKRMEE